MKIVQDRLIVWVLQKPVLRINTLDSDYRQKTSMLLKGILNLNFQLKFIRKELSILKNENIAHLKLWH